MEGQLASWVLLSLAVTLNAEMPEAGLKFEIHVYNYAGLSPEVLQSAEQETARIYEQIGVESRWLDCPLSPEEASLYPACQLQPGPARFALRLLSRAMAERGKPDPLTFGFALFPEDGGFGTVANVFSHRAEELAKGRESAHAVILGHLMAHELGHLLLGTGGHSASGIMRVPWFKKELELVAQGSLLFTPWEGERIRSQVRERRRTRNWTRRVQCCNSFMMLTIRP